MTIAVLGTGEVGRTIATKLVSLGHEVVMGSRSSSNEKAEAWVKGSGGSACHATFAEAAASAGELVFSCTLGSASLDALRAAGERNLAAKILVDISNPLDFSRGTPSLLYAGDDSLGERIQKAFPRTRVVKTLNTVTAEVMVDPGAVAGEHDAFMCGNDPEAKEQVSTILREWFGWKSVVDLGDITASRAVEAYLLLWLRLYGALGTASFNIRVARQQPPSAPRGVRSIAPAPGTTGA